MASAEPCAAVVLIDVLLFAAVAADVDGSSAAAAVASVGSAVAEASTGLAVAVAAGHTETDVDSP